MKAEDLGGRFAADIKALQELRATARGNPREGLRAAAQQFEALFMQMMLKSMRDASPQDGLMDSEQTRFYTTMFDQQLAQNLAAKGSIGFARLLEQQLGANLPEGPAAEPAPASPLLPPAPRAAISMAPLAPPVPATSGALPVGPANGAAAQADFAGPRDFVARIWPHAVEAAAETGIPPRFVLAHAALESGWGRGELRRADGSPSFNLFGIKAGRRWSGDVVEATTTEFVGGVAQNTRERFRAYGSYLEAFRDYASLLRSSPRFSGLLGVQDGTEFARLMQQSGYATDPMYADKLNRIIHGSTIRQALLG